MQCESETSERECLERSKLLYLQGRTHDAIEELSVLFVEPKNTVPIEISSISTASNSSGRQPSRGFSKAKGLLFLAKLLKKTGIKKNSEIESIYKSIMHLNPGLEKHWFSFGQFNNDILQEHLNQYQKLCDLESSSTDKAEKKVMDKEKQDAYMRMSHVLADVVKCYVKCLQSGTNYVFETLPRLLTLWMDYSVVLPDDQKKNGIGQIRAQTMSFLETLLTALHRKTPSYALLTTLPQLISRICHTNETTYAMIEKLIVSVLIDYPHQTLWQMVSAAKSSNVKRSRRCQNILSLGKTNETVKKLTSQAIQLSEQLLNLCNHPVNPKISSLSINKDFGVLKRMVPMDLLMPLQSSLTPTLPQKKSGSTGSDYRPFATDLPTIQGS